MAILSALSDGGDVSPLESIEKLTVTALQDRIREAKAECARYIPMPLVEAAVAYIRAINPGESYRGAGEGWEAGMECIGGEGDGGERAQLRPVPVPPCSVATS